MANTTIRQAVFADLEELAPLFDQHRVAQGQNSDLPAARGFLQARFNHGESVLFVAVQREVRDVRDVRDGPNAAVGLAQLYPSFSSTSLARVFVLNDLFVHASARRQGVASQLLAAVERYAWQMGAARVSLNVTRDNSAGQALYRAQGWRQDEQFFMFHRYPPAA